MDYINIHYKIHKLEIEERFQYNIHKFLNPIHYILQSVLNNTALTHASQYQQLHKILSFQFVQYKLAAIAFVAVIFRKFVLSDIYKFVQLLYYFSIHHMHNLLTVPTYAIPPDVFSLLRRIHNIPII